MTITPAKINQVLKAIVKRQGIVSEDSSDLFAKFELKSAYEFLIWTELSRFDAFKVNILDATDYNITQSDFRDEFIGETIKVYVRKPCNNSVFLFFTVNGFRASISGLDATKSGVLFLVAESFSSFKSYRCQFDVWRDFSQGSTCIDEMTQKDVNPNRIVRDLTTYLVPDSANFWLEETAPTSSSRIYRIFKYWACRRLIFTFCNEVELNGNLAQVILRDPREKRVLLKRQWIAPKHDEFLRIQATAKWLFLDTLDSDVRHTFLAYELAREWPESDDWISGLKRRLKSASDAAQISYRAHLRAKSEATLSALTDLRKAVNEEASSFVEQSRDMVQSLRRDFAISAGAIVVRVFYILTRSGGDGNVLVDILMMIVIVYLGFSLLLQLYGNKKNEEARESLRSAWHQKLYGYLTEAEFDALSKGPIQTARRSYNVTKIGIIIGYVFLVLALGLVAGF